MKNLVGLVLMGGKSERMTTDKSQLLYYEMLQCYKVFELLKNVCDDVYLLCNIAQASQIKSGYKFIIDDEKFAGNGPISGLLTAIEKFPNHSFLVVAIDYPYLQFKHIQDLLEHRNNNFDIVCYRNKRGYIEPLIAVYENVCFKNLINYFTNNKYSLRLFIEHQNAKIIEPFDDAFLQSIDTFDDYIEAKNKINIKLN